MARHSLTRSAPACSGWPRLAVQIVAVALAAALAGCATKRTQTGTEEGSLAAGRGGGTAAAGRSGDSGASPSGTGATPAGASSLQGDSTSGTAAPGATARGTDRRRSGAGGAEAGSTGAEETADAGFDDAGQDGSGAEEGAAGGRSSARGGGPRGSTAGAGGATGAGAGAGQDTAGLSGAEGATGSRAGRAGGAAGGREESLVVGMVDAPGTRARVDEEVTPQTLGGFLPLVVGVDEEGQFDFDKAVLRPEVKDVLDVLATQLQEAEYDRLDIIGFTDRIGTEEYNQQLSERRAWAVARYLMGKGVPLSKLRVEGRGERESLLSGGECADVRGTDLIACLQRDRRVQIEASVRRAHVKVE